MAWPPSRADKPIGRRAVLGILGLGGLGIAFGQHVQNGISDLLKPLRGTGLAGLVPGGGNFTLYTVTSGFPAPPPDYKLTVNGMVERPLQLSVGDLETLPATRLTHDFQCVTGWVVDDVHWTGSASPTWPRSPAPTRGRRCSDFSSFDGVYTETLTTDQADQSGAIAAYSMLGGPVSKDHGGPVRLYVPGMSGYKSIKWLSTITLTDVVEEGYWEQNGYPVDAWVNGHGPSAA